MPYEKPEILQIVYQNPQFNRTDDWAREIACQNSTFGFCRFPFANYEWMQVLAPSDEYDKFEVVGATGWMINPHHSDGDFPHTHPFLDPSAPRPPNVPPIFDWEFALALDRDPDIYQFLLARGNLEATRPPYGPDYEEFTEARGLGLDVSNGLLGVEIDGGLVPAGFKTGARTGERVAVFGRWIVDTAHEYGGSFRSEIHPPLLMARASVQPLASGQPGTRVLFTSRPYLVGQRFTEDTTYIYDDSAGDDGHALEHFVKELLRISGFDFPPFHPQFHAHGKIKSYPFLGAHFLHIKVRPPAPDGGRPIGGRQPRLAVSFQFTVRRGVNIQVASMSPDTVDIFILLNQAIYTPPPLPPRRTHNWRREEVAAMGNDYGFLWEAFATGGLFLEYLISLGVFPLLGPPLIARLILEAGGIQSSLYELPNVDINDAQHAVTLAWADEVPPGAGIHEDNGQPFPIFGWLEATWQVGIPPITPVP